MAIPAINVLGNPNVTEGNFQIAIEDLRKSVIGSGKAYDSANTYSQYDTCVSGGVVYYSKIDSNTGNTPIVNANWGLIGDLFNLLITNGTALGYGIGSGGIGSQGSYKTDTVSINKPSGQITMASSSIPANSYITFLLSNSNIGVNDTVEVIIKGGVADAAKYYIAPIYIQNESVFFKVENKTSSSLSEAIVFNFKIIKGAVS